MNSIGAVEAKTKLSKLLDRVESGEEIIITRRGRRVAKLIPLADHGDKAAKNQAAVEGLKKLHKELSRSGSRITQKEICQWVKEGRRY